MNERKLLLKNYVPPPPHHLASPLFVAKTPPPTDYVGALRAFPKRRSKVPMCVVLFPQPSYYSFQNYSSLVSVHFMHTIAWVGDPPEKLLGEGVAIFFGG